MAHMLMPREASDSTNAPEPIWTTPHSVKLELSTASLRDFSTAAPSVPTMICAPYALHHATIADFAPQHSLVAALLDAGVTNLFVTDWRSATPEMRYFSIDTYLAELNVMVDSLGGSANLVGLCQGGWLSLMFAARFPAKVRKLVLAGAPIDTAAGSSLVSLAAEATPTSAVRELLTLGDGRALGQYVSGLLYPPSPSPDDIARLLQTTASNLHNASDLQERFLVWVRTLLNLPGTYYLEVVEKLYKLNQLATGHFTALGQRIDLSSVRSPLFMLAARDDELVAAEQTLAAEHLVGTSPSDCVKLIALGRHVSLFMGKQVLSDIWPAIAEWLNQANAIRHPREAAET